MMFCPKCGSLLRPKAEKKKKKDDEESDYDLEPGKRDDPIVYLTGGPGAQATYYIKRFKDHGIRKHRDMYILEQRGIGYSDDFCPYYNIRKPEIGNVATFEEHLAASFSAAVDCAVSAADPRQRQDDEYEHAPAARPHSAPLPRSAKTGS